MSSFGWNSSNFRSLANIETDGVQIDKYYFPSDETYVSDEYVASRSKLMKYNTFKPIEASEFKDVFTDAGTWTKTFDSTNFESGWIQITFKNTTTPRAYSFDTFYLPLLVTAQTGSVTAASDLEVRLDCDTADASKLYSKRVTASGSIGELFTFTIGETEYTVMLIGLDERILVDDNTKVAMRFLYRSTDGSITMKTCWDLLQNEAFATAVFNEASNMNLQTI